jgi:4-amino-4-deoxy-L-arabinose transferase-like glycosyltransferase
VTQLFRFLPALKMPPTTWFVGALAFAYALPGLFGHAPWKPEDAIGAGIVHQMLEHGRWLMPHLAGEAYLEDGPLFYWIAAALAKLTAFVLDHDDGARLAAAVAVIATWFFLRDAARELFGRAHADGAMLVLLGSLGLLVHAHENLAELGLLAGLALAWHGMALAPRKPIKGGAAIGVGLAIGFLCKGIGGVIAPWLVALALWVGSSHWRNRSFAKAMAIALVVWLIPSVAWLTAAGSLAGPWLDAQWSVFSLPDAARTTYYFKALVWVAWPAWPVAVWFVWERRRFLGQPGPLMALLATLASLMVLLLNRDLREVHALPLLLPLALLAGAGVERLRRGAANALAWFGAMTFSVLGLLVWLGWFAMQTGMPERIARNFEKLEPGHVPVFQWLPFVVALLLSLAWIYVLTKSERSVYRSVLTWGCGATLAWGLAMTLWLSWIDYGKSYESVAKSLQSAITQYRPLQGGCMHSIHLGESQRGAFDYHAGIVTVRYSAKETPRCPMLLVQAQSGEDDRELTSRWRRVWEGNRPRDRERYRLYVRITADAKQ